MVYTQQNFNIPTDNQLAEKHNNGLELFVLLKFRVSVVASCIRI